MTSKKIFTYKAECYCRCCGNRLRDVKLMTNYELEDEQPSVYSNKMCKVCRTGEVD